MKAKVVLLNLAIFVLSAWWLARYTSKSDANNKMEGYWIMSNYVDGILEDKSISKAIRMKLTWAAILLKVEKDTIRFFGTIQAHDQFVLNKNKFSLEKFFGNYQFTYKEKDIIKAISLDEDSTRYIYRRVKETERSLIMDISDDQSGYSMQLRKNLYPFFIDSLISGTYIPIENMKGASPMKFKSNGKVEGFKKYNSYSLDDYFGTLHICGGADNIWFIEKDTADQDNQKSHHLSIYSWEFRADTLVLTKMLTETYDSYFKSEETYTFLKMEP